MTTRVVKTSVTSDVSSPRMSASMSMGSGGSFSPVNRNAGGGSVSMSGPMSVAEVSNVKQKRDREKKDMQDLNSRFAGYIEKVRFLEAQNRKLVSELDNLKSKWGRETQEIKRKYDIELKDARTLIDELTKDKAKWEIKCHSLEDDMNDMKKKYEDLNALYNQDHEALKKTHQQLSDYESEINLLRRRIAFLEEEHARDKAKIKELTDQVYRLKLDLDNETLGRIAAEHDRQALEDELAFLKSIHEQELKELRALIRDQTGENRQFWKNEMALAIRDISSEYEERLTSIKAELEGHYNMKMNEANTGKNRQNIESTHYKEENKKLRNTIQELRAKITELEAKLSNMQREYDNLQREYSEAETQWDQERQDLTNQYNDKCQELESLQIQLAELLDAKLSLELEIIAYRKLLEGDGSLGNCIEKWFDYLRDQGSEMHLKWLEGFGSETTQITSVTTSKTSEQSVKPESVKSTHASLTSSSVHEMAAKTTVQRSAKGNIAIKDAALDGKVVIIENTGGRPENLNGWKVKRVADGKSEVTFDFPMFTLQGGGAVKIWAKGQKAPGADGYELRDHANWGTGANCTTYVYSSNGDERATHIQRTVYST